ncbi:hypothetical protein FKM82_031274 [Ascaphus truei]
MSTAMCWKGCVDHWKQSQWGLRTVTRLAYLLEDITEISPSRRGEAEKRGLSVSLYTESNMDSLYEYFLLLLILPCAFSQIRLEESGPGFVRPSTSMRLTCKVSGASITDLTNMYGVGWVRQQPGKGLEWVGSIYYNGDTYLSESLRSRLTVNRDTSKHEVYMALSGTESGDTATYYCARIGYHSDKI